MLLKGTITALVPTLSRVQSDCLRIYTAWSRSPPKALHSPSNNGYIVVNITPITGIAGTHVSVTTTTHAYYSVYAV